LFMANSKKHRTGKAAALPVLCFLAIQINFVNNEFSVSAAGADGK